MTSRGDPVEGDGGTVVFRASESSVVMLSNINCCFNLTFRTKTQIVDPLFSVGASGPPGGSGRAGRGRGPGHQAHPTSPEPEPVCPQPDPPEPHQVPELMFSL